jgi:cytochrome c oxidase cbb3-type subunit 2
MAGKGDGPAAPTLTDDWDNPIRAADFTSGILKAGPTPAAIYRTVITGLSGTPMPSYDSILTAEDDRWGLAYYILSLSADQP